VVISGVICMICEDCFGTSCLAMTGKRAPYEYTRVSPIYLNEISTKFHDA